MPKSVSSCNSILALLYNATTWPNIAVNATASPLTDIAMSLHTASLTPSATQATSESAYTNYVRKSIPRSISGFTAPSAGTTQTVAPVEFDQCGLTGSNIVAGATGKDISGAGIVFHYGDLNSPIAVSNLIQPRFAAGAITITES